jgi:hypothetical protein
MWILILSQTEHTKRLMEDPEWEGGQLVSSWMATIVKAKKSELISIGLAGCSKDRARTARKSTRQE